MMKSVFALLECSEVGSEGGKDPVFSKMFLSINDTTSGCVYFKKRNGMLCRHRIFSVFAVEAALTSL